MANPGYVRSTDGDNADNGSSVALANATISGGMADAVAGDRVWVATNHAEVTAGAVTVTMPGTLASPTQLYCGDFAAEPPTAVTTGATVTTTGASNISLNGTGVVDGVGFNVGTGSTSYSGMLIAQADGNYVAMRNCDIHILGTNANLKIQLGVTTSAAESRVDWENVNPRFSNVAQTIDLRHCKWHWHGGAMTLGSTPTTLVTLNGDTFDCLIENVNFSSLSPGMNIFASSGAGVGLGRIRNCRLPSGWTGSLGQPAAFNTRFEMWNCSAGDSMINLRIADVMGELFEEATVVRTGGATDGVTLHSYKMDTSATAEFPSNRFEGPEHAVFNTNTGVPVTLTVEIIHNGVGSGAGGAIQNDEFAIDVMYPSVSGYPLYAKASSMKSNIVGAASDYASSTETWTTTGLSTPVKQKISVTFTPQKVGTLIWKMTGFRASTGIYYCPEPSLTT